MRPPTNPRIPALLAIAVFLAGCGDGTIILPEHSSRTEEVIGGDLTCARREIGRFRTDGGGLCTATLVAPNVILTAAHCVDYESASLSPDAEDLYFEIDKYCGDPQRFYLAEYVSYSTRTGKSDLTLARLRQPVPAFLARPARLADERPAPAELVTIYGHGCRGRDEDGHWARPGAGPKSSMTFLYGTESDALCGGDSGGPVVRADGSIYAVNSAVAYYEDEDGRWVVREDRFGDVVAHRGVLAARIAAWSGSHPACLELVTPRECAALEDHCTWHRCSGRCFPVGTPEAEACGEPVGGAPCDPPGDIRCSYVEGQRFYRCDEDPETGQTRWHEGRCRDGVDCRSSTETCTSEPDDPPPSGFCAGRPNGYFCDGDDRVFCGDERERERTACDYGCAPGEAGGQAACAPPPDGPCGLYTSREHCDLHPDRCAWYLCAKRCLPRGTDPELVCDCDRYWDPDDCTGVCAWYVCQQTCLPRGTDVDQVCGTHSPGEDPPDGFCAGTTDGNWCDGDDLVGCRDERETERSLCPLGCAADGPGGQGLCIEPEPEPDEPCGAHPDATSCDAHADRCAWYTCAGLCLPRGTDVEATCGCARNETSESCSGDCAWYICQQTCLPRGTDTTQVCGG